MTSHAETNMASDWRRYPVRSLFERRALFPLFPSARCCGGMTGGEPAVTFVSLQTMAYNI
ncbi:MAG: hypothetical protein K2H16_01830 [Prevotella sp.]|nr:hypothetical protein [Prevotella sp.]